MLQLLFDVLGEKGIIIIIRIVRITHAGTTLAVIPSTLTGIRNILLDSS